MTAVLPQPPGSDDATALRPAVEVGQAPELPAPFGAAVAAVRAVLRAPDSGLRHDVVVEEVTAPRRLAPYAAAFTARVPEPAYGHGRFILLHDPERAAGRLAEPAAEG